MVSVRIISFLRNAPGSIHHHHHFGIGTGHKKTRTRLSRRQTGRILIRINQFSGKDDDESFSNLVLS